MSQPNTLQPDHILFISAVEFLNNLEVTYDPSSSLKSPMKYLHMQ